MTILLGALLAAGLTLTLSPWLWPRTEKTSSSLPRSGRLEKLLAESGYASTTQPRALAIIVAATLCAASIVWLVTQHPVLALLAALVGGSAPITYLRARRLRLRKARRALWPDVCDLLVASIRVGQSLPDAVAGLATTAPVSMREAFAQCSQHIHSTGRFEEAIDALKHDLADPAADRIIETLRMARQVGGTELTHVLRSLSESVRAEATLRAEVEARQSWIRGAAVLGVTAPWVIIGMLVTRPEGAEAYSSWGGIGLILVGAAVCVIAFRIMLRIGQLTEPERWFA
ncbi:type II secretion system F family protein [Microbacterium sp. YY-01]|uniref:type II secretion system F family protein n=1 Tax=Microbacterium sp. YY-01 TaxID=3421634 RepID=UPI003D17D66D